MKNGKLVTQFGTHLMIDGYGGNENLLNKKFRVLRALQELPEALGMHKLADPVVYEAPENGKKDEGGWSGFVVIAESHISVHTFPRRRFASIDVYTCQNKLSSKKIVGYFKQHFGFKSCEVQMVKRGTKYPIAPLSL